MNEFLPFAFAFALGAPVRRVPNAWAATIVSRAAVSPSAAAR